jgi:MraZ protein
MLLRGNHGATVDGKGRLKIPARFRDLIRANFGSEMYVTCLSADGSSAHVFPLAIWQKFEQSLSRIPLVEPARRPIEDAASYFGLEGAMDRQGRVLISQLLRKSAQLEGQEVCVLGKGHYLEVWRRAAFEEKRLQANGAEGYEAALHRLAQYPVWDSGDVVKKVTP